MALKVRTMKLDDATWERWQARAAVASTSVAALIVQSMEGQASGPSEGDLADAISQIVAAKDQEIASLKDRIAFLESEKDITKGLFDQQIAASERMQAKINELEEAIIYGAGQTSEPLPQPVPGNRGPRATMGGMLMGNPVLSSAVPTEVKGEAHSFFKPNQRAALDVLGQAPTKGKGKR
jgi:hypothetical protein